MSVWVFLVTFMTGSLVVESTVHDFPDKMTCQMYGQVFIAQVMSTGGLVSSAECVEERSS
jgi:hypothetical protein